MAVAGKIVAKFRAPVYDGDELSFDVSESGFDLVVKLINAEGTECATAKLLPPTPETISHIEVPAKPLLAEDDLPLISYRTLQNRRDLNSYWFIPYASGLQEVRLGSDFPARHSKSRAEVEVLAVASISIMYGNFRARGPRILTALSTRQYESAYQGQTLEARGCIEKVWRWGDRTYARNDVLVLTTSGVPIVRIHNTTIWELP